jgi:hypothetical protein
VRPEVTNQKATRPVTGLHYRDEGYHRILVGAIRGRNLGAAREIAERWRLHGGKSDNAIVDAWLDADQTDEAIAYARKISAHHDRILALLRLADDLLTRAGAPMF